MRAPLPLPSPPRAKLLVVRYNEAQRVAQETSGVDVNVLFRKQAQWEQESGDKVQHNHQPNIPNAACA